ncbi:hypothetical protein Gasu2_44870 [Galdieria sulphuraria]|nr:hypothetical protein Gasu2_44870 [Galdieria sulphuraria]
MIGFVCHQRGTCCKVVRINLRNCQISKNKSASISRRGFLALLRPSLFLIWCFCNGKGQVVCDMCEGTGFWKAITPTRNQYYKGVSCPQCSGSGYLTCPVCLGTGLGEVKGLLRRDKKLGSGKGLFGIE